MSKNLTSTNVAYLLHALAFNLDRQSDQVLLEQLGIGFAQFKILFSLQVNPKVRQKQLANSLSQTEASVSRQIKLLRNQGILVSRINPKNKRERLTLLTPKGLRIREAAVNLLDKQYEKSFSAINQNMLDKVMVELLEIYAKSFKKSQNPSYRHLWENMI